MLLKGRDAWSVVPSDRFNVDAFYHPSPGRQGSTVVRGGYYLKEDVGLFDAPVR
jgi:acyl transferase domain-containing protein